MKRTCIVLALVACTGESRSDVIKDAPRPVDQKPKAPDYGSCTVKLAGALTAEQTSEGGTSKSVTSYWFAPGDKGNVMFPEGKVGLVLNCTGKDINLNILTKQATKDSFPFGPRTYELKKGGKNTLYVLGTAGKTSLTGATGTIDITAFDGKHIAGTIALEARTLPGADKVTITGSFDFKCPGFSGCAK